MAVHVSLKTYIYIYIVHARFLGKHVVPDLALALSNCWMWRRCRSFPYQAPSKELGHENADNESKKMEAAAEEKKVRSSKVLSHTASYKQLHMRKMARRPKSRKQRLGRRVFIFVWERADFIVHLWHEQK